MATEFLDGVGFVVRATAAVLPSHAKGTIVWSDAHEGLVVSDGTIWQNLFKIGFPFKTYSGDFIDTVPISGYLPANGTQSANIIRLSPFIPRIDFSCDQVDIEVSTLAASSNCKILVYDSDGVGDYLAGTLLFNSGDISTATTGLKVVAVSPALEFKMGKLYWVGVHSSHGTGLLSFAATLASGHRQYQMGVISAGGTSYVNMLFASRTYASGPPNPGNAVFTTATKTNSICPRVRLRVV